MIIVSIYLVLSFLLEGVSSLYVRYSLINPSIFMTLYVLIGLVVIYPYFINKKKYMYLVIIFGILFDVIYTNTLFINLVIFILIYLFNRLLDEVLPNNIFVINIKSYLAVILYYTLTYVIMVLTNYASYPISMLFRIYYSNIIMSVIYTIVSYIVLKGLTNKFNVKEIK